MNNLASSYIALARYSEAAYLYEQALTLQKVKLGLNHPDTLSSMEGLARSYSGLSRHSEAVKLYQETLTLQKAKLGLDHPETLHTMDGLARSYIAFGRYADAIKLQEHMLTLRKTKFGPRHPDTLVSVYNLACIHALMIPRSRDRPKQCELAMEWLKKAAAAGYNDTAQIKKDSDLNALRDREDFKKLLAELEAKR
jgi:tetratricopeptide (TPR) repeat protein